MAKTSVSVGAATINLEFDKAQAVYVFDTSKGAGVPGLPHEITEAQAAALGVSEILLAAIANGSYTVAKE